MHGVAHHVLARPPLNLTLTGHADGAWIQLPQAGKGHVSTFSHSMSGLQTSSKSMMRGPSAHVNRSSMLKPVSSLTTVPASRPSPTTPTRRTRANRSCRARAAAVGHLRSHEEAYGGGGTQDEKGSAEAWHGALGRTHTRVWDVTMMIAFIKRA